MAPDGHDAPGRGSRTAPFATIQYAIDAAAGGETVVVFEGHYRGPGNRNLDFRGKAITVRSRAPVDDRCLRATILDAEGQGVVVRFVHGEGPGSVFSGFTVLAGDTAIPVRGTAGFFELAPGTRPTLSRLRIGGEVPRDVLPGVGLRELQAPIPKDGWPFGPRLWEGVDPFHQPANTTHYYGSGDVDGDGTLTAADVALAAQMAAGLMTSRPMADVDGDAVVDGNDVALIDGAVLGGDLPAWWNRLATRAEREQWVERVMALDSTDSHPYAYWFQCLNFDVQTLIHGAYYGGDLHATFFNGGATLFNLPIYHVSVTGDQYGHGINAILVGNDPLSFDHWRFLEPQNDGIVEPGMWDMPFNTDVRLGLPIWIRSGGFSIDGYAVEFHVDESGWTLEEYRPDLVLNRQPAPLPATGRGADPWNPTVVPATPGMLLFDWQRDDMTRSTDLHLKELPFTDPAAATPLTGSSQYSRLLDAFRDPQGTIHLLWTGKPEYVPGVFYGQLAPAKRRILDVERVSQGVRMVRSGRVRVTAAGERHVFWLERKSNTAHPHETGIYWTRNDGGTWQAAENLAPRDVYLFDLSSWQARDVMRYYFDVAIAEDGRLILAWNEPLDHETGQLKIRAYDGHWRDPATLENASSGGVALTSDATGTLHLVSSRSTGSFLADRGQLVHRSSADGQQWSVPQIIDASGQACCPRMAAGEGTVVDLVWERETDDGVVPVWGRYFGGGTWSQLRELAVRPGADAWYPMVARLPDGEVVAAWSSRSAEQVTIETATLSMAPTTCTPGPNNLCLDQGRFRVEVAWRDFQGQTGAGRVVPLGSDDSGLFWFFNPDNWEMLVKVLDGCSVNNRRWVFAAATTNVGYTLTVTDMRTGAEKQYTNPLGVSSPAVTDASAFASCP